MKKQVLSDPYSSVPADEKVKIQTWFPHTEEIFLAGINPVRGTFQYTINKLLKGLIDECRANGITCYDHIDRFIEIVNRRSSFSLPAHDAGTEAVVRNVGGREADLAEKVTQRPDLGADSPKRGAKGKAHKGSGGQRT